jgi:hypothetical protein
LRVVIDHEITRDVARLSSHSRERREHDTVLQIEMSDFRMAEQLAHDVILKRVLGDDMLAANATRQ